MIRKSHISIVPGNGVLCVPSDLAQLTRELYCLAGMVERVICLPFDHILVWNASYGGTELLVNVVAKNSRVKENANGKKYQSVKILFKLYPKRMSMTPEQVCKALSFHLQE